MAEISNIFQSENFETIEQANTFLQDKLASGALNLDNLNSPGRSAPPLQRAQDIFWQAIEAKTRKQAVALARKALAVSEDCADAWVFLAKEEARTQEQALELYDKGIRAGERALGKEAFEEMRGHFWGFHETRPYMRARAGAADVLWSMGRQDEAISHWEEMLSLNPNDNQGIRMVLLPAYLETNRLKEAGRLLQQYPDDASCDMAYGKALLLWRLGDVEASRKAMKQAFKINKHVPGFLLGRKKPPRQESAYITWGGEDEAAHHFMRWAGLWTEDANAVAALAHEAGLEP